MIFVYLYPSSMMMLLLVDCRRNQGPCHQVESYSLAGHSEEHMPGLVDDILGQLLAQEFDKNIHSLLQNVSNETELLCMYSCIYFICSLDCSLHHIGEVSFKTSSPTTLSVLFSKLYLPLLQPDELLFLLPKLLILFHYFLLYHHHLSFLSIVLLGGLELSEFLDKHKVIRLNSMNKAFINLPKNVIWPLRVLAFLQEFV